MHEGGNAIPAPSDAKTQRERHHRTKMVVHKDAATARATDPCAERDSAKLLREKSRLILSREANLTGYLQLA